MANNFKDTNIYGNFTVKPLYATYSNIGVASGSVTVPAYFQNTGNTDLNNVVVSGNVGIGTTTATEKLHVSGNVNIAGDNATIFMGSNKQNSIYITNGIRFRTSGSLSFLNSSGDSYPLIVEQNGNMGLGSINPTELLHLYNGNIYLQGSTSKIYLGSKDNFLYGNNGIQFESNGGLTLKKGTLYTFILDTNGNLALGSTTPTELLHLLNGNMYLQGGASKVFLGSKNNYIYGDAANMAIKTDGDIYIQNLSSTINKMFIKSDGKIFLNTYSPSDLLDVNGNVKCTYLKTSSDYRLKHNVQPINGDYDITKLRPVSYQMGGCKSTGFIAHEMHTVFPFLVSGEKDGEIMQSIDYIGMIAILTHNIQNLKKEMDELKCKLNI